jgi:transcriptional regulatory protein LevR
LLNPPREEHQRFSLYYEFACVISAMVSEETVDAVDSQKFMNVFLTICPQFKDDERTYCIVVSTNELSYIHISILLINFLFFPNFRGRVRIHHFSERKPAQGTTA